MASGRVVEPCPARARRCSDRQEPVRPGQRLLTPSSAFTNRVFCGRPELFAEDLALLVYAIVSCNGLVLWDHAFEAMLSRRSGPRDSQKKAPGKTGALLIAMRFATVNPSSVENSSEYRRVAAAILRSGLRAPSPLLSASTASSVIAWFGGGVLRVSLCTCDEDQAAVWAVGVTRLVASLTLLVPSRRARPDSSRTSFPGPPGSVISRSRRLRSLAHDGSQRLACSLLRHLRILVVTTPAVYNCCPGPPFAPGLATVLGDWPPVQDVATGPPYSLRERRESRRSSRLTQNSGSTNLCSGPLGIFGARLPRSKTPAPHTAAR